MSGNHTLDSQRATTGTSMPNSQQLNSIYPEELLQPSKGIDLREFWHVIVRRKKLLALFVLGAFLLTLLLTLLMKPVYRASTTIQIEREPTKLADMVIEPNTRRNERDFWQTQIELMKSKRLASTVIEKLNIEESLKPKPGLLSFLSSDRPAPIESNFLENLSVEPLNNSQLFLISYESTDPEMAANVANSVAESYIEMNYQRRFESVNVAKTFIEKEISTQNKNLLGAQKELQDYAQKHEIIELDNGQTTKSHRIKKLADELSLAERKRNDLEAELKQFQTLSRSPEAAKLIKSDELKKLDEALEKLEIKNERDTKRYGSRSRRVKRNLAAIEKARDEIDAEKRAIEGTIKTRLASAKQSEDTLRERFKKQESISLDEQGILQNYQNLKRNVETNQTLLKSLQENSRELGVASTFDTQNVSIIDRASIPHKKFKPNPKMNLLFGLLAGLLLGIAAIFLREFMDDSVKDIEELERFTDLPLLGTLPYMKRRKSEDVALQIVREPKSKISEAIRSLRTTLSLSTQDGTPKMTFITSSGPGEGKSTTSLNLAAAYATSGYTVLLIDADLRSPSIHSLLKLDPRLGLSNYLTDNCELNTIIQSSSIPGLYSVVAGSLPPDPVELLSGLRMKELLKAAREEYDFVIVDGPPVLGLADALILANLADATILTVHSGVTRKGQIATSLKRLQQSQAHVIGTLLNHASFQKSGYNYDYLHYSYGAQPKKGLLNRVMG